MLVADRQGALGTDLLFNFQACLLRVSILNVWVHRGEADGQAGRRGSKQIGEYRRSGLPKVQGRADQLCLTYVGCVAARKQCVRKGPQCHAVIEDSSTAANQGVTVSKRRPGKAKPWRDVVRVGVNALEKFQVIAYTGIQRQSGIDPPLVLSVYAKARVRLRNNWIAKRLGECAVSSIEEVC